MRHFTEEELIAYQLHESNDEQTIRHHLDVCSECASVSDSIAETLRVFSANPVPQPDLGRNWQRLRGNLSVLTSEQKPRFSFLQHRSAWAGLATAAIMLIAVLGIHLHRQVKPNYAINDHGPLTAQPINPNIANHIDAAERLLTEVNNAQGPLDSETRDQAHALLLTNAVYVRQARTNGNLAEAAVLDNLNRVLTTLDNEPPTPESTWRLRIEMNTSGLLFDLRVLHQNDVPIRNQQQGLIQ